MRGDNSTWDRRTVLQSMAAGAVGLSGATAVAGSASASHQQIDFWALDQTTYVVEYEDGSTTSATTTSDTISHDNDISSIEVDNNSYARFQFDPGYPAGDAYDEVIVDGESGTQYQIDFTVQGLDSAVPHGAFMNLDICEQDTSAGTTCRETFDSGGWFGGQTSRTLEITLGKISEVVIRDGDATVEFPGGDDGSGSSSSGSSGSSGWW